MPPKIAVVIPAYNHAAYIGEAVASVLAQDWPAVELHVLDDGSADDTAGEAARAAAGQMRVRVRIERQDNQGSARALNRLIAQVDADYVAVLNSDDLHLPGRYRACLDRAAGRDSFFGFTGIRFIESGATGDLTLFEAWYRSRLGHAAELPTCGFALLNVNLAVSSSNFLFSRRLFDDIGGFDPTLPLTQDWSFLVAALRWTEPVLLPERLMAYRVHPDNTWRRLKAERQAQSLRVLQDFAQWADQPCRNRLAPTPANWPAFFSFFARVCDTHFSDEMLGASLPPALVAPREIEPSADEQVAMQRLLKAARRSLNDADDATCLLATATARWGAAWSDD